MIEIDEIRPGESRDENNAGRDEGLVAAAESRGRQ